MLRELEYFRGIVIMTTNRILTFDVAMLSRCHYAINFGSLSHKQEKEIWKGYLSQLDRKNCKDKKEVEKWVAGITKKRTKLNGRDIRNIFTTAQTLAQAEIDHKVRKEHLERIFERLVDFIEEMEKTVHHQQSFLNAQSSK
jgi:AAA+ superfamily predicted ATPase